jgi:galactonate dehydratase
LSAINSQQGVFMKVIGANIYLVKSGRLHPVIVELLTDEGLAGIGEAAIAYGLGGSAAAGMIKDLVERIVIGKDPHTIEAIWSEMYDHSFWAKGGGPIIFAGISAIEQALWDIKGKALNAPIYQLLGGKMRDKVQVYANGWCLETQTPTEFGNAGEQTVKDGFNAIKCYPLGKSDAKGTIRHVSRRAIDKDHATLAYEKVKALRSAVGPDVDILIDLSGGMTTGETIRLCQRFEEFNINFIEEPADPFDVGALKRISDKLVTPIAVGERLYTRYGFRRVMESQAADILQPDIGNTGGFMECKKIAAMAEAYNLLIAPHNCASPLASAAALQLDACITNFSIQEIYPYWSRYDGHVDIIDDAPERRIKNGYVDIPDRPGIGVELNHSQVAPFLWATIGQ